MRLSRLEPVGALPIQGVLLATRIEHRAAPQFEASSLPGHLLHFVLSGRVVQQCNGREYELAPGCVLWYHEDEHVRGRVIQAPWTFYSVNFVAPLLPPPPFENRLIVPAREDAQRWFADLVGNFNDEALAPMERTLRVHGALLHILALLLASDVEMSRITTSSPLWWQLEAELRQQLHRPIDLALMERLSHNSAATLTRACHQAVGVSPMKRIKQIRLSLARGLLERSQLTVTEIAHRVGYPRVHEFSRDYRRHFGHPPSQERRQ